MRTIICVLIVDSDGVASLKLIGLARGDIHLSLGMPDITRHQAIMATETGGAFMVEPTGPGMRIARTALGSTHEVGTAQAGGMHVLVALRGVFMTGGT